MWRGWNTSETVSALAVACTYVGTVVGAGFASGQEIQQFFGRFQGFGWLGVAAATALFAWLGYRLMWLGWYSRAASYRQVNAMLFGPHIGGWIDTALSVMLFGVIVVMLAGAGQLAVERLGLPFWAGVWWTVACTWLASAFGIAGVLRANSIIVPVMLTFVVYAAWATLGGAGSTAASGWRFPPHPGAAVGAAISCLLYVAYNLGLASGVLIPVGAAMSKPRTLRAGAVAGAFILGVMLTLILWMLHRHAPAALGYEVPMGYVAEQLGSVGSMLFTFALWGEIFSTLVGNVFALCAQIREYLRVPMPWLTGALLCLAQVFSWFGFAKLVAYAYTIFGGMALVFLMALVWVRRDLS